jgi:hypothetical protein
MFSLEVPAHVAGERLGNVGRQSAHRSNTILDCVRPAITSSKLSPDRPIMGEPSGPLVRELRRRQTID